MYGRICIIVPIVYLIYVTSVINTLHVMLNTCRSIYLACAFVDSVLIRHMRSIAFNAKGIMHFLRKKEEWTNSTVGIEKNLKSIFPGGPPNHRTWPKFCIYHFVILGYEKTEKSPITTPEH